MVEQRLQRTGRQARGQQRQEVIEDPGEDADRGGPAVDPGHVAQAVGQQEGDLEGQEDDQGDDEEAQQPVADDRVDGVGEGGTAVRHRHTAPHDTRRMAVTVLGDQAGRGLPALGGDLADQALRGGQHPRRRGGRALHPLDRLGVVFEELDGQPAWRQGRGEGWVGGDDGDQVGDGRLDLGSVTHTQRLGGELALGHPHEHVQEPLPAAAAVSHGGHHRHPQPLGQLVHIDGNATLNRDVVHVQGQYQGPPHLGDLQRQVEVALEV